MKVEGNLNIDKLKEKEKEDEYSPEDIKKELIDGSKKDKTGEDTEKVKKAPDTQEEGMDAKKKGVLHVIKDAYNKKIIGRGEYDTAMHKLLKKQVSGVDVPATEFKILRGNGTIEMILERGEIDISTSHVEVRKEDGRIKIRRNLKAGEESPGLEELYKEIPFDGGSGEDSGVPGIQSIETDGDRMDLSDFEDMGNISPSSDWLPTSSGGDEGSNIRENLELIDIRREFQEEAGEKEELTEEEKEEEEPGILDGVLDRFSRLTGRLTEERKDDKLRRLSLENLSKVRGIADERRAIVGVAYVLKQFLQIRFNIPREVTYHELTDELRGKDIDKELKERLLEFFKRMPLMMYAKVSVKENLPKAFSLAEKTIKKLSEGVE